MKCLSIMALAAAIVPISLASGQPAERPSEPLPLSEIAAILEKDGYDPLVEASFDDGEWEVEAFRGREAVELTVNPLTGEVTSSHRDDAERRPPEGSLALSKVIRALEKAGYTNINEVSFERRYWEVEADRDGKPRELYVDPKSGEVVSDRADD